MKSTLPDRAMLYRLEYDCKLLDIQQQPQLHKHTFEGLKRCCTIGTAIDGGLVQAHAQYVDLGSKDGVRCDTLSGPCVCGTWH